MIEFNFDRFAKVALKQVGVVLVNKAQSNMAKVSHGRVYIIGGKPHIASKIGDTANNASGKLSETIDFKIDGKVLEFGAGNESIDYAKYLENPNGLNRPNYTKTILQSKKAIDVIIGKELMKNLRFTK